MGITCSNEKTCYVACTCASGWSTSAPSGEYVYAKDDRYANGLSSMSANGSLSSMSANGNLSTMSDNYSISTMATNGGMTCYKKACPSGYYLDKPASYFAYTTTTGTLGLTCYKVTGCSSCYATNAHGASYTYHGYTCKAKTCADATGQYYDSAKSGQHCSSSYRSDACLTCYSCHTPDYSWCPSGFQASKCGTGYHETDTRDKECQHCSAKSGTCYKCEANSCEYYGYKSSQPSGQTCEPVKVQSGSSTETCYKDCKSYYTVTVEKVFDSATCPSEAYSGFNGISGFYLSTRSQAYSNSGNSIEISEVPYGTTYEWNLSSQTTFNGPGYTAKLVGSNIKTGTVTGNITVTAEYTCEESTQWPSYFTAVLTMSNDMGTCSWVSVDGYFDVAGFEPGVDQHIVLYYDIPGRDTYFGLFGGAAKYQPNGAFSATEHVSKICATNGSTSFTLHSDNGRTSIKMLVRNIQSSVEKEITIGLRGVIEWQG